MRHVQILEMPKGSKRWRFIAHGAPYDIADAEDFKIRLLDRGAKVRFLSVPKD